METLRNTGGAAEAGLGRSEHIRGAANVQPAGGNLRSKHRGWLAEACVATGLPTIMMSADRSRRYICGRRIFRQTLRT
ncbi:MAG TPA: hypothetical protein DC058_09940 [Planctomycetaceae bacterium]|nr:hypothetical protein [Planctomycetaceae bacterium]HBC61525.1 hypothetical protein [Planctomycetaceae bacterium]